MKYNKIIKSNNVSAIVVLLILLVSQPAFSQVPSITPAVPDQADFPDTQICVDIPLINTGPTGFGPYLQIIVPDGLTFDSATLFGSAVSAINEGVFPAAPGNQLDDSIINQTVTGPEGDSLILLQPPIGSVVENGPPLNINFCYTIDANAEVNVPLTMTVTPVFEFGASATGSTPIIGVADSFDTTPILVLFRKEDNAPENERPPGPSWPVTYTLTTDIANNNIIDNIVISDVLPTNFVLTAFSVVPAAGPNCTITSGATLTVNCDAITGTNADDVVVTYTGYYSDVLDEANCGTDTAENTATFDGNFAGTPVTQLTDTRINQIEHISMQKGASPFENLSPGNIVTFTVNLQVSDYGTASSIQLQDILPDGYTYIGNETFSLGAIAATFNEVAGVTTLDFDVTAANGGNIAAGTAITLTYEATVDPTYDNTEPLLASDSLTNTITNTYGLTGGAAGCTDGSAATTYIEPVVIHKEILTAGPYVPGQIVTYRLSMSVPSGDTKNVVFKDFFPLPVFEVAGIDTTLPLGGNTDIRLATNPPSASNFDTLGLDPTNITANIGENSLTINWPDITTSMGQTLAVDIDVVVTTDPFADDLKLSNLLQVSTENTGTTTATDVTPVLIQVRAPELVMTKGVLSSDQGAINPLPGVLPVDGDLIDADAGDTVTFTITVENQGGAEAFDVIITDPSVAELTACTIPTIVDGTNTGLVFVGTLDTGITLTNPLAENDGTIGAPYAGDTALVTFSCTVAAGVEPGEVITNTATSIYASIGGGVAFPEIDDISTVTVKHPTISKSIIATAPNLDGDNSTVTIGETIQYRVVVNIPEGATLATTLVDTLDTGLIFQSFDSITASAGLVTSHVGGFLGVLTDTLGVGTAIATFPFDDIGNPNSDNATADTIIIVYTVIVQDVAANSNGGLKNNSATFDYDGGTITDNAPNVTIEEPILTVAKTVNPTSADAGDTVSYTVIVTNTGPSTAYNVVIADDLVNVYLDLSATTVITSSGVITTGNGFADTTVQVDIATIAAGASVTVTFDATLAANTPSGESLVNTATADYSSLPGGGRVYPTVSDTATVGADPAVVSKTTLNSTSTEQSGGESSQGNAALVDLTIGEQVTYRIVATLAEGVSPGVIITDTLPNNATGHMDITGFTIVSIGASLTPTNAAPIDSNAASNILALDFGSITNTPNGVDDANDQIIIEITAIVRDTGVNSGLEILTNNVIVQYNGPGITASASSDIEVVEPRMTTNKTGSTMSADAGDTITFTITMDNVTGNNSSANAFDVDLADVIPAGYTYVAASINQVSGPLADGGTLIENAGTIQAHWTQFDLGDTVVITYQVTVDNSVAPGQVLTNTADVIWSSLPGVNADERDGSAAESHSVTMTSPGVNKSVTNTSEASSGTVINGGEPDILIGEEVTYQFTITIPEGTSVEAVAGDQLPTASTIMSVVSSRIVSIGTQLSFTPATVFVGDAGVATDTDADTYNDNVEWVLGDIFNLPDGTSNANDQITFEVVAILVDEVVNQNGGNDIVNTASFSTGSGVSLVTSTDTALIDIIEPVINVSKATVPNSITADAGDVLDYQITITHDAASNADAYNFTVTDVLPVPGTQWLGFTSSTCGAVATDASTVPTVIFTFDELLLTNTSCVINYQVTVTNAVNPSETFTNTVTASYQSTDVPNSETRTDTDMDSTSFITPDPAIVKVTASSSLGDTGDNEGVMTTPDLAIGETIDFTLTVIFPEGTTTNAMIADVMPLIGSGGMLELIGATVDATGGLTTSLNTITISDSDADLLNDTVVFDFGTVINAPDGTVDANDQITMTVTARVVDNAVNVNLDTLTNTATFSYDTGADLIDTADVEVVEPILGLAKSMGPMTNLVVPITLTFSNTGNAPAYDITIEDILDSTIWDVASISEIVTPAGYSFASTPGPGVNQTVSYTTNTPTDSIAMGAIQVFTFNVTLRDDVVLPATIPNTATVTEASSLPGFDANERDLSDIVAIANLPIPLLDSDKSVTLVADTNGSGAASPTEVLEYTITIVNSGDGAATGVQFTDAPDANVTLINGLVSTTIGSVTTGNTGGDTLIDINVGTIPANTTVTIVYRVTINNPLGDGVVSVSNQGLIELNEVPDLVTDDPTTGPNDDPTVVPIDAAPDLAIVKDDGGLSAIAGGTVVYTIGYNNIGTQGATGVVVTETVPLNSTFDAANSTGVWSCAPNNSAGSICTQNIGNVNAGDPVVTTDFAVTVDSPLADGVTQLSNDVSITDDGNNGVDLDNSNNDGNDTTPLTSTPDMQIIKNDAGTTTVPGGTVVYTLTYTNAGDQDATGVTITETVPANTTFDPASSSAGWVCVPDNTAGSTCTLAIGNVVGNGGTGNDTFAVIVDAAIPAGVDEISNNASVADDGTNGVDPTPGDNTTNDTTPITATPDLAVVKDDRGIAASPGDTIVYDLDYTNIGNQGATGVVITETVPANTTFDAASSDAGWVCSGTTPGSTCSIAIGNLAVGATGTVVFATIIDNPLANGVLAILNSVGINDDGLNGADQDLSNNTNGETTPLGAALPDLVITKDDGGISATPGATVIYTISYDNIGNQDTVGVVITETVPANSTFDAGNSTGVWTCLPDNNAGSTCTQSIGAVNVADAAGATSFAVTVDSPLASGVTQLFNNISIADDGSNGPDLDINNNSNSDTTPITAVPDLQIVKDDGGISSIPGSTVTYTLTYTNVGNQNATGVVITETVPVNTTFNAGASSAGWVCVPDNSAGSTCTLAIGSVLGNNGTGSVDFAVTVDATLATGIVDIINSAGINDDATNGADPTPADNSTNDNTPITAQPDMSVTKTDNNIAVAPASTIVYDISYDNVGNQEATGVVITETVPANTTFNAGASSAGWVCAPDNNAGSTCTFAISNVSVGAGAVVQFAVTIIKPLPSGVVAILNTVTITDDGSNGVDPNTVNNTGIETTPLGSALPNLTINKDDAGVTVEAGDTITYVINYSNIGNQTSENIVITETVPANSVFNSGASTAGWVCAPNNNAGSSCTFSIATLAGSGASETVNFAVDVDSPLPLLVDTIANSVTITDDGLNGVDSDPNNNNGSDTTPVTATPDMSVTKVDQSNSVMPGGTIVYDISYQNIGAQDASGVVITETVPANTTFNSGSSSAGWSCVPDGNAGSACTFNVGNVTVVSGLQVIQFSVIVDTLLPAGVHTIENLVSIADDGMNGVDPVPSNNNDPETTTVVDALPNIYVTKTDNDATSGPGQTVVYDIGYGNLGNQGATGVVITETVPDNSTFNQSASSVTWVCAPDNTAGSTCTYVVGALVIGATGSVTFAIEVDDPLALGVNLLVNNVSITDDGTNGNDSDPTDNTATDDTSLQLNPPVGLKIGEFDAVDPRIIHWTFWWFNPNNDRDLPVFIFDDIPAQTTFVGNASCTASGTSTCTMPVYNAGLDRIELTAILGEDEGATVNSQPEDLNNVIVIRFDVRTNAVGVVTISNQAEANWDEDNNGDPADDVTSGQSPILTDNPLTNTPNDSTVLYKAYSIPMLSLWSLFTLFFGMLLIYRVKTIKAM